MSNLKNRLATLESKTPVKNEPIRICIFAVDYKDDDLIAYKSDCGAVINRLPDESVQGLMDRCGGLANWEHEGHWRVFEPIF